MIKPVIHSAPLQGITDYMWRNAHNKIFGGIDIYHVPFMRIERGAIRQRDINDVLPKNNSAHILPQIIACNPDDARLMIDTIQSMGYRHIELNLGCPHPPLAKKHKGSGMMAYPDEIESLANVLSQYSHLEYSVKMRLGWDNPCQWNDCLIALAPLSPKFITIHPRIGTQQYKGELLIDEFEKFLSKCHYPVIYNGEIKTLNDIDKIMDSYPDVSGIMMGRGLVANPSIVSKDINKSIGYRSFHEALLEGAASRFTGGAHQILSHMKTIWAYFLPEADKKTRKQILKAKSISQYNAACNEIFSTL